MWYRPLFFVFQCLLFQTISITIDTKWIHSFRGKDGRVESEQRTQLEEREDVRNHKVVTERKWTESGNDGIRAKNLKKVYVDGINSNKMIAAVNDNSFTVKKGEVFGLLGPNGAGKSSMFNVMTMDLKRSDGEVRIMDTDIDDINVTKDGNKMGMCPQFNPIWKNLTVD